MARKRKIPREEAEVLAKISRWCDKEHPEVEVQKSEYEKLIEGTGKKKIIDATIIGHYKRKSKSGAKGVLIAELEFEEHQAKYSILNDTRYPKNPERRISKITALLRKLPYWRADIPQYWIKIDKDGTPFMINYRYIYENREKTIKMPPHKQFTRPDQLTRIIVAAKDSGGIWPTYVIIGWDNLFRELDRIIKLAGF